MAAGYIARKLRLEFCTNARNFVTSEASTRTTFDWGNDGKPVVELFMQGI